MVFSDIYSCLCEVFDVMNKMFLKWSALCSDINSRTEHSVSECCAWDSEDGAL